MFSLFIMIILSVFLGMLSITSHFDHFVFNRTLIIDHAWADVYSTFDYLLEHETGFDEKKGNPALNRRFQKTERTIFFNHHTAVLLQTPSR